MFKRRPVEPDWQVEDVAGRLRRLLAVAGPDDARMKHTRTQEPNTDPTLTGLAVAGRPATPAAAQDGPGSSRGRLLRLPAVRTPADPVSVPTASHGR